MKACKFTRSWQASKKASKQSSREQAEKKNCREGKVGVNSDRKEREGGECRACVRACVEWEGRGGGRTKEQQNGCVSVCVGPACRAAARTSVHSHHACT